jgi:hypothetical protein
VPTLADYRIARQAFQNGYAVDADGDGDPDLVGAYTVKSARWFGLAAGSRVQDGVGTPGEAGAAPVLGATGPFRGGHVETLLLRGIPGPTFTMLGISLGTVSLPNVPMPGLTLRVDPASLFTVGLFVTGNGEGRAAASTSFSMPLPHGLQGLPFYVQGFALDAAAAPGVTNSNLLIKQIGN